MSINTTITTTGKGEIINSYSEVFKKEIENKNVDVKTRSASKGIFEFIKQKLSDCISNIKGSSEELGVDQ